MKMGLSKNKNLEIYNSHNYKLCKSKDNRKLIKLVKSVMINRKINRQISRRNRRIKFI